MSSQIFANVLSIFSLFGHFDQSFSVIVSTEVAWKGWPHLKTCYGSIAISTTLASKSLEAYIQCTFTFILWNTRDINGDSIAMRN